MNKKNKIHQEIERMFGKFQNKPLEQSDKLIYGVKGDISNIGSEKNEADWLNEVKVILNKIEIGKSRILRYRHDQILTKRVTEEEWEITKNNEHFLLTTGQLLKSLSLIRSSHLREYKKFD